MEEFESEFKTPAYTTLSVEQLGTKVVRTVIFEHEIVQFEVDRQVYQEGRQLQDNQQGDVGGARSTPFEP